MPNVAINGLGRIGRAPLKILLDADGRDLVAVNDIADLDSLAYLLRYDTVYGRYHRAVDTADGALPVDGRRIAAFAERDPAHLPWADLGMDLVLERTGVFKSGDDLQRHIQAGASFVILSAPSTSETVPTVVHGVNRPGGEPRIVSRASCTTNWITPVIEVTHRHIGVQRAVMTTIHAYTAGQQLVDGPAKSFRRGRAGAAILGVSEDPSVSADIVGDPRAAVVDRDLTRVVDDTLVKVMAWYDNEWGFTHQMIREARSTLGVAAADPGR
jgi:glyceraldehyde 3-phosphate dehydrogenase